jgi:hypothetical protein
MSLAMLSGTGEVRKVVRRLSGLNNTCGDGALFSDESVSVFVVRHANVIVAGATAKIGYGAGQGARIGSAPAPARVLPPHEWTRIRSTQRRQA